MKKTMSNLCDLHIKCINCKYCKYVSDKALANKCYANLVFFNASQSVNRGADCESHRKIYDDDKSGPKLEEKKAIKVLRLKIEVK